MTECILKMGKQRQQRVSDFSEVPHLGGGWSRDESKASGYYPFLLSLLLPVQKAEKSLHGNTAQPQDSVTVGPGAGCDPAETDPNAAQVRPPSFRRTWPRRGYSSFQGCKPCTLASVPREECSAGTFSVPQLLPALRWKEAEPSTVFRVSGSRGV